MQGKSIIILFVIFIGGINCASIENQQLNYPYLQSNTYREWSGRIVGGQTAEPGQFPYQISLRLVEHMHLCGGSIIRNDWIVTAAHCTVGYNPRFLSIVVGAHHFRDVGQLYTIKNIIVHPDFHSWELTGDIACIQTDHSIQYSNSIQPISFGTENDFIGAGVHVVSSGWGTTYVSTFWYSVD